MTRAFAVYGVFDLAWRGKSWGSLAEVHQVLLVMFVGEQRYLSRMRMKGILAVLEIQQSCGRGISSAACRISFMIETQVAYGVWS